MFHHEAFAIMLYPFMLTGHASNFSPTYQAAGCKFLGSDVEARSEAATGISPLALAVFLENLLRNENNHWSSTLVECIVRYAISHSSPCNAALLAKSILSHNK
jgi:hypothetical protein